MATPVRPEDKAAPVLFRMSRQDRDRLHEDSCANGFDHVQQYLEYLAFGVVKTPSRSKKRRFQQEELEMSA